MPFTAECLPVGWSLRLTSPRRIIWTCSLKPRTLTASSSPPGIKAQARQIGAVLRMPASDCQSMKTLLASWFEKKETCATSLQCFEYCLSPLLSNFSNPKALPVNCSIFVLWILYRLWVNWALSFKDIPSPFPLLLYQSLASYLASLFISFDQKGLLDLNVTWMVTNS